MPQYITIKNFGPITSVEKLEIKNFMIFIGERATGKSTIAKSIFFFKSLRDNFLEYYFEILRTGNFDSKPNRLSPKIKDKFMLIFGSAFELSKNAELVFQYSEDDSKTISISIGESMLLNVNYSKKILAFHKRIIDKCDSFYKTIGSVKYESVFQDTLTKDFHKSIEYDINEMFSEDGRLVFIPAQRSLLTTFSGQIVLDSFQLDYLTSQFIREINNLRIVFRTFQNYKNGDLSENSLNALEFITDKALDILKGKYVIDNSGTERLFLEDSSVVKLNFASSGQQESLWILNIIQYLAQNFKKSFLVIEEPESHLDPKTQVLMTEAIVCFAIMSGNQVLVTTHSPYVLAAVNNLMYAHRVALNYPEQVMLIVPDNLWLEPCIVAAYETKGRGINNLKAEDGLMKNEKLDEMASIDINRINNDLFALENEVIDEL